MLCLPYILLHALQLNSSVLNHFVTELKIPTNTSVIMFFKIISLYVF